MDALKALFVLASVVAFPAYSATVNIDLANAQFENCGAYTCTADGYSYDVDGYYASSGDGVGLSRDSNASYSIFKDVGTFDAISFAANFSSGYVETSGSVQVVRTADGNYEWLDPTIPVYGVPDVLVIAEGYSEGNLVAGSLLSGRSGPGIDKIDLGGAFSGLDELRFTLPDAQRSERLPVLEFGSGDGKAGTIGYWDAFEGYLAFGTDPFSGRICINTDSSYCDSVYLKSATLKGRGAQSETPEMAAVPLPLSGLLLLGGLGGLAIARRRS